VHAPSQLETLKGLLPRRLSSNPHFVLSLPVDKVTLSLVLGRLAHTWLGFRSNKLLSAALGCTPSMNRPLCLWGGLFQCLAHCSLVTPYRLSQEFPSPHPISIHGRSLVVTKMQWLPCCWCRCAHVPRPVCQQRSSRQPVPVSRWDRSYADRLEADWDRLLQLDLASSTHKTYTYHQEQYRTFCSLMGRRERPEAHTLAQFVIGRAQHGYALSTIEQGVYAVQRWGADLGIEQLAANSEVQRALKVAARLAVPTGRQKLPLDRRDLRLAVYELASRGQQDYVSVRDRAMLLLGWSGMFRSSELVGIDWEHVPSASQGSCCTCLGPRRTRLVKGRGCLWPPVRQRV